MNLPKTWELPAVGLHVPTVHEFTLYLRSDRLNKKIPVILPIFYHYKLQRQITIAIFLKSLGSSCQVQLK